MAREVFNPSVKQVLAERTGSRCSFPECDAITSGPNAEAEHKSARTGMACHIYAASDQTPARRRTLGGIDLAAASNGVWMCFTHGKLIDTDETTYTVSQLLAWKRIAELRADFRQKANRDPTTREYLHDGVELAHERILFTKPDAESALISQLLLESGATVVWGKRLAYAARDFAVEVIRNAFEHGGANHSQVSLTSDSLEIEDDGALFGIFDLPLAKRPRGGARALQHMLDLSSDGVIVTSRHIGDRNVTTTTLTSRLDAAIDANPCVVTAPAIAFGRQAEARQLEVVPVPGCAKTYLVFRHVSFSDVRHTLMIARAAMDAAGPTGKIALIFPDCSDGVMHYLRTEGPEFEIVTHTHDNGTF